MSETSTIRKDRALPSSQDYEFLRQAGLRRLETLATRFWTDFNVHDPGITILEVLCYALTDLGYRTDFEISDLLARPPGDDRRDFFTAAEILTCNPVSVLDFRKLIIDQEGVQNGWLLSRSDDDLAAFVYRCRENRSYEIRMPDGAPPGGEVPAKPGVWTKKVLDGLYDVRVQLAEHDEFGDLNTNVVRWEIENGSGESVPVRVVFPRVSVRYPGWDHPLTRLPEHGPVSGSELSAYSSVDGEITFDLTLEFEGDVAKTVEWSDVELLLDAPDVVVEQSDIETALEDPTSGGFASYVARRYRTIMEILHRVHCAVHRHRNLCEDFVRFEVVPTQKIMLCADVDVTPEADVEEVLARIYHAVDRFLAPPVRFYDLDEMYERGHATEEIFQALVPEHGFIDPDELARSNLRTELHVSDLYRLIMEMDEVVTVRNLQVTNYLDGEPLTDGERWCLDLGGAFHTDLDLDRSKVVLRKDALPFRADDEQVRKILRSLKAEDTRPPLTLPERDLPVPRGAHRDLEDYVSIQTEFPLVYGVGNEGLSREATALRKAQAKQLKAFLMFFDQLLADYLAQLAAAKDLLSVDPDPAAVDRTYAVQPLHPTPDRGRPEDFPGVAPLLKDFVEAPPPGFDPDDPESYSGAWEAFTADADNGYRRKLRKIAESREVFLDRRNRFLDHLIARSAEAFTDYAVLMHTVEGRKSRDELIDDKEAFLAAYPEISAQRGRGFQLRCYDAADGETGWLESNVSGLKKRLCGLLGIDVSDRRRLGYGDAELGEDFDVSGGSGSDFTFVLRLDGDDVLESEGTFPDEPAAWEGVRRVVRLGADAGRFVVDPTSHEITLEVGGEVLARSPTPPADATAAADVVETIVAHLRARYHREGLHVFEHLLLRPVGDQLVRVQDLRAGFYPECDLERDCECPVRDHYSFRITVVLPYWPERFRNMDFRDYVERTIRRETPAHVLPRICWVDPEDMEALEERYLEWLEQATRHQPGRDTLSTRVRNLVKALNDLTSVYPEGRLHDCEEPPGRDEAIMLDRSRLGTFEETSDENPG